MFSPKNLYPGINTHLNNYLQQHNTWRVFHTAHIVHLSDALNDWLPSGYYAQPEDSLQIVGYDSDQNPLSVSRVRPDVNIRQVSTSPKQETASIAAPTFTIPLVLDLETENTLSAVVIYQIVDTSSDDKSITRIELLSPSNKHNAQYFEKRRQVIESGVNLIEIDYLNLQPPLIHGMPDYLKNEPNSFPYWILVSSLTQHQTAVFGINVLDKLPTINIPLSEADKVATDFNDVYQTTYTRLRHYSQLVNYAQEPVRFDAFTAEDQKQIEAFLAKIREENK